MQIQPVSFNQKNSNCNFKSVYRVYHWHKPEGAEKYFPTFDIKTIKRYQRILLGMLNKTIPFLNRKPQNFQQEVSCLIARFDSDYRVNPFVRTVYNPKGGPKVAWNGNVYDIEPNAYILTGGDAVDFEQIYGRRVGYAKADAPVNQDGEPESLELNDARTHYAVSGLDYAKKRADEFFDKNGNPIELHTIFKIKKGKKTPELQKIQFFHVNSEDNPLVKHGRI